MVYYPHKTSLLSRRILPMLLALLVLSACNKKDDKDAPDAPTAPSVAVTKFSIKPNPKVMDHLDSVYFSIDLEHRVIFNADSLPLGTKIDKLVPLISYPSTVAKAEIIMSGGTTRTGTVDYIKQPTDSIDFTGDVKLRLSTKDDALTQTYTLKVNVHKCVADSLVWDKEAVSPLPARSAAPHEQRTVSAGSTTVTLIREADGTLTLAKCGNPMDCDWTRSGFTPPFDPEIRSLSSLGNSLYILDTAGKLYRSGDFGDSWDATGTVWNSIIGAFGETLLGITESGGSSCFDMSPRPQGFSPAPLPSDFPTEGYSNFNTFSTKWSSAPIGFLTGGVRDGITLNHTWAFDGESWAKISNNPLPPLREALVIPYFCYRKTNASWIQTEYSVWLCMGGLDDKENVNNVLYISFDNGVNWNPAPSLMQYPDFIRPGYAADAVIRNTPMSADLDAHWKNAKRTTRRSPQMRLHYFVDGSEVEWECPYIYLLGGHDAQGRLNDEIRRAVLARLTFAPIF